MKKVLSLALATAMVASLTACGGSKPAPTQAPAAPAATEAAKAEEKKEEAPAAPAEVKTIKFSLSHASTEPAVQAANEFAEALAAKTNGSLKVEVYPENQLGSERDVVEGLQLHTVEMVDPANAVLTNFVKETMVFELPMLFETKEDVYAVLDDIGMGFAPACEAQGFKLLGWFDMGTRNIMTVKKPINSMDDLKGMKIRTQESAANMAGFEAFGAAPTPMAYNELYTALESGVLDGAEAANTNYASKAFYEVAPYWAIVGWLECVNPVLMDLDFYNKLSADEQAALEECVAEMVKNERVYYAASEETSLKEMLDKGAIEVTYPDKAPFQAASQQAYEKMADQVGGMDAIMAVVNYGK